MIIRFIVLSLITLFAIVVGSAAGVLSWLDGSSVAGAALRGGAAFGAFVVLAFSVLSYLTRHDDAPPRR